LRRTVQFALSVGLTRVDPIDLDEAVIAVRTVPFDFLSEME